MVNIYKINLTILQQEVLRLLFAKTGCSLNQRQISKLLDVSPPAVMKALPFLEKENLIQIKKDKETKRWSIKLNTDNHMIMQLKRADNIKQIYESGFADFLAKEFAGATIILFGSYSRGDDTLDSDIDIAVIGRKDKLVNLEQFEKMLRRKIMINFYDSFKNIHKNLKENLFNGIVLSGGIKL